MEVLGKRDSSYHYTRGSSFIEIIHIFSKQYYIIFFSVVIQTINKAAQLGLTSIGPAKIRVDAYLIHYFTLSV